VQRESALCLTPQGQHQEGRGGGQDKKHSIGLGNGSTSQAASGTLGQPEKRKHGRKSAHLGYSGIQADRVTAILSIAGCCGKKILENATLQLLFSFTHFSFVNWSKKSHGPKHP
jgi:hypothetical protein